MILYAAVFFSDASIGYCSGRYFDARQARSRKAALGFGLLLDLCIGVNAMGFVREGWPVLLPSLLGGGLGTYWSLR